MIAKIVILYCRTISNTALVRASMEVELSDNLIIEEQCYLKKLYFTDLAGLYY